MLVYLAGNIIVLITTVVCDIVVELKDVFNRKHIELGTHALIQTIIQLV